MTQKFIHATHFFSAKLKINQNNYPHLSFVTLLISFLLLSSCQVTENNKAISFSAEILHSTVSASYAPDGRLWRLLPTEKAVYVDYSNNDGKTYSNPVKVNKQNQIISTWPENPPAIVISNSGRINVLYYADEDQKSTSFFSYSDDNGQTFSTPVLVSDYAASAMHYMDKMLIDKNDKLYLFWHDTRHESDDKELGVGVLSLYYSEKKPADYPLFRNRFIRDGICSCCPTATTLSSD